MNFRKKKAYYRKFEKGRYSTNPKIGVFMSKSLIWISSLLVITNKVILCLNVIVVTIQINCNFILLFITMNKRSIKTNHARYLGLFNMSHSSPKITSLKCFIITYVYQVNLRYITLMSLLIN